MSKDFTFATTNAAAPIPDFAATADPTGATAEITAITATPSAAGPLGAGATVTFALTVSQPVSVTGSPFLTLNDGGTADYDAAASTATSLVFTYQVAGTDNTGDLQVTGLNLNGGAVAVPGSLTFASPVTYDAAAAPVSVTTADVNGDGDPDLIVADQGGVSVLLGDGSGDFSTPTSYLAVPFADAVTTADVNGDGQTDLVVTGQLGTVAVLLGNGGGGFSAPTTYAAGPDPVAVTTADVNGDGKPDLIIADYNGGISVLLGNGGGGFSAPTTFAAGTNPESVTAADLTGDGIIDLIVGDAGGGVAVLMGNGSGGFAAPITYAAGPDPEFVTTADVNGDGKLDLIVADEQAGVVSVLLGNGSGGFSAPTTFAAGPDPVSVTTADVNGDSNLDLIVADAGGGVAVLLGNGSGGFSAPTTFDAVAYPTSVTTADVNGDGLPDLIAIDGTGGVSVLLNDSTGPGTFDPTSVATAAGGDTGLVVDTTPPTVVALTSNPASGDFGAGAVITLSVALSAIVSVSGGVPGLALSDGGTATYVSGSGTTTLVFSTTVAAGQSTADLAVTGVALNGAVVQDLAGNAANLAGAITTLPGTIAIGTPDVVVTAITATPSVAGPLDAGQNVTFSVAVSQPVSVTGAPTLSLNDGGVATYSAAASSATDLVFTYIVAPGQNTTNLAVTGLLLNGGAVAVPGSFGLAAAASYAAGPDPISVTTADVNGDGNPDLIVADGNGGVSVLLGNGGGGFLPATTYAAGLDPTSVTTADLTGNGQTDLIVADASGSVAVLLGNGSGGFAAPVTYAAGPDPVSVTTADVNGDGHPDIIVADQAGGVSVLLGTGDGGFNPATTYDAGPSPASVTTADINGDGKLDLVVADQGGGVSVLLGDSSGGFSAPTTYDAGPNPVSVTTADLNGDGSPGLVVADSGGGITVLPGPLSAGGASAAGLVDGAALPLAVAPYQFAASEDGTINPVETFTNVPGYGTLTISYGPYFEGQITSDPLSPPVIAAGTPNSPLTLGTDIDSFTGMPDLQTIIEVDGSAPTPGTEVLGGVPVPATNGFGGPIAILFSTPVSGVTLTGGDFDAPDAVTIAAYSATGESLGSVNNLDSGYETFNLSDGGAANIAGLLITSNDGTGFGIDDVGVAALPSAATYAAGPAPVAVTTADLNGDGIADLIVVDSGGDGGVSVLLGQPGGGYSAPVTYASGPDPVSVTVADVNGDGKPDLIVADADGGVSVLLNNSTAPGTFSPASAATVGGAGTGLVVDTTPPTITGTQADQSTTNQAPKSVFAGVTVTDAFNGGTNTDTLNISYTGPGTLSGSPLLTGSPGGYSLSGTAAAITAALQTLSFTPVDGVPNTSVTTTFTLTDTSPAYPTPAIDSTTTLIDRDLAVAPTITGTTGGQTTTNETPKPVFAGVTIGDANNGGGDTDTLAISYTGSGTLSGSALLAGIAGDYSLTGTATKITAALRALLFTPVDSVPNTTVTTTFTLRDTSAAYPSAVSDNTTTLTDTDPAVAPTISGTLGGQTTTNEAPKFVFAGVTIGDANNGGGDTDTLTISYSGPGTLAGSGLLTGNAGNYSLTGTAAVITAALRALSFTPVDGVPNTAATTTFTLSDSSAAYSSAATDNTTTLTDTDPAVAPTISGTLGGQTTTNEAPKLVFAGVTIGDANNGGGDTDTLTISYSGPGTLAGSGLLAGNAGNYSLTGTAAVITAALRALSFTPVDGVPNTSATTTFTLSDSSAAYSSAVSNNTTTLTDTDPAVAPTISGTLGGQTTTNEAPKFVFAGVTIGDANNGGADTDTLAISYSGPGTLAGSGLLTGNAGNYSLTGTAAVITAALRALSFTPVDGVPNTAATTTFTLRDTSAAYPSAVSDNTTTLTDTDPAVAITIKGTITNTATIGHAQTLAPFSAVSISDTNAAESETATITLSNVSAGTLAFATGGNSGLSLSHSGGVYTIGAGTAAAVDTAIDALVFTPAFPAVPGGTAFDLTVTDTSGKSAMLNTGTVAIDPGPVVTGSVASSVNLGGSIDLTSAILGAARGGLAGDTLTITADSTATTLGKVTLVNGDLVYDAVGAGLANIPANGARTDTFGYSISDSHGDTTTGTATVTVKNPAGVINGPPYGFATIEGTSGADIINAFGYFNTIYANGGNDVINAGLGDAVVYTSGGNVVTNLSGYFNAVSGGDGDNTVAGAQGSTNIMLGNGSDSVSVGGYFDTIDLGNGNDTITGPQGSASVTVGNGIDTITLAGYNNVVHAGSTTGTDTINAGAGAETVTGGNGNFNVTASGYSDIVTLGSGTDVITGVQGLASITTGAGNDTIILSGYGSTVNAGGGDNAITGGSGDDMFFLPTAGSGNFDTITNFTVGNGDMVNLAAALAAAGWNSHATLANYLKVSESGGNAIIAVANGGTGVGTAIAELAGVGNLTLPILQQHAVL